MNDGNISIETRSDVQKKMSPNMRVFAIIIFAIISIFLLLVLTDKIVVDILTSINGKAISATITKIETTKSKSVYSYWIYYVFENSGKRYERKSLFGLMPQGTEIRKSDRQKYSEGSTIDIVYSSINPQINKAIDDPYKDDKNIFMLIGIILFGFMAIHEVRSLIRYWRRQ
jgi:hypothetical protein